MPTLSERRRFPRVAYAGTVEIRTRRCAYTATPQTLSLGGLSVQLDEELELRSLVAIHLQPNPRAPAIVCQGRVNWVTARMDLRHTPPIPHDVGIEFLSLSAGARRLLRLCVDELRNQEAAPAYRPHLKPTTIHGRQLAPFLRTDTHPSGDWELLVYEGEHCCYEHRFPTVEQATRGWRTFQDEITKAPHTTAAVR
ncbi:MAG: PilZ domain-containing protein [Candidatus Omnitrophica bacterium]|nr:PilZ domain-containing protein [Candidatus Omnitrophota bacterium]